MSQKCIASRVSAELSTHNVKEMPCILERGECSQTGIAVLILLAQSQSSHSSRRIYEFMSEGKKGEGLSLGIIIIIPF